MEVSYGGTVDIAEFSSDVANQYPLQVVRYADVAADPSLKFTAGVPTQQRNLNIVLGKNVEAGRLVAGFTMSEPGNWSSWPPHEHTAMLEEMYVYFNMPDPAFAIQMVYENTEYPETRDGGARRRCGAHAGGLSPQRLGAGPPHVFPVGDGGASREALDRQFGVVNVQPGFGAGGSGLEASHK